MPSINMTKRGNAFKLWTVLLLTVGICWVQSHTIWRTDEDSKLGVPNYPTVVYELDASSPDAYREMIARLRQLLTSNGEYRQGIPVLREDVRDPERYVLLQINVRGRSVTFAIDVTNVYIVAYLIGNTRYFFEEAPCRADQLLFTDAPATSPRRLSSNYVQLERRARPRANINLGLHSLENAIGTRLNTNPEDAQSFIIVIQMVAEAVRYWEIEWYTIRNGGSSFLPNSRMIDLENNWGALSTQIQISEVFAFQRSINISGQVVDSVQSAVINALFLMLFICRQPPPAVSFEPLLQMTRLDPEEGSCKRLEEPAGAEIIGRHGLCLDPLQMVRSNLEEEEDDDTCKRLVDPRSRIKGRDGLCVDVEKFMYVDNNPVILYDCRNSDFRNQLWNFRRDGRIVSLEKCLAASGDTPGSTVMIHECDTLHESAVEWTLEYQGTLYHTHSGLVLTAASGISAQLTLESDNLSSFQAWESTNTSAADVYIHGENNQCIYYDGKYGVYTEQCHKDYSRQKWKLYPDGTIRPIDWLEGCMELASLSSVENEYNYIQAEYCSKRPEYHRWIFTHQGRSIMNLKSRLVVDADMDSPGYLKAAPFKGGLNQIWTLEFM